MEIYQDLYCTDCKTVTSQFYKGKNKYDGKLLYTCKACGCENNVEDERELDKPDIRDKVREYISKLDT